MTEVNGKRLLVYIKHPPSSAPTELAVVDVTDVALMAEIGAIPLPYPRGFYADFDDFAFSSDGRYVFVLDDYRNFAAMDLVAMSVVDSIGGNYRFTRMAMFESETKRMFALQSFLINTGASALLLVDATDPADLKIIKQSNQSLEYLTFSKSGNQLIGQLDVAMRALSVPSLATIWEKQIPDTFEDRPQQIMSFGQQTGGVIGAWGINTSLFGSFQLREADLSIATYGAHGVLTGANINYYFRVVNNGPTTATGVTLTDKLPAGLSLVSVTPSAGLCGGTTTVTCDFGDLPAGQSVTVKVTATPIRTGTFINTASVKSSDLDPVPSNNKAAQSTTLVPLVLTLTPSTVYGPCQSSIMGRVSISSPAPSGGVEIHLTNGNSSATTPSPVTIPAGKTSVDFPIQITPAANIRDGYISAIYNGRGFGVRLIVLPRNGVQSLTLSPNPVTGGQTVTGRVRLACKAATNTVVTLSSSNTSVASPTMATINIPAGGIGGTFTISTADVSALSTASITAKANGFSKSAILTVQ
jgi:uncharacterized repeat protein (TIGR01451 family)